MSEAPQRGGWSVKEKAPEVSGEHAASEGFFLGTATGGLAGGEAVVQVEASAGLQGPQPGVLGGVSDALPEATSVARLDAAPSPSVDPSCRLS